METQVKSQDNWKGSLEVCSPISCSKLGSLEAIDQVMQSPIQLRPENL